MTNNTTTFGLHNLTTNTTGIPLNETASRFGEGFGSFFAGSAHLSGLLFLGISIYFLFKADAGIDTSVATLFPLAFFLAYQGFLPTGDGIISGLLIGAAAVFTFGTFKFAFR